MQGTDFTAEYNNLKQLEIRELIDALNAHGGAYVFTKKADEEEWEDEEDDEDDEFDAAKVFAGCPVIRADDHYKGCGIESYYVTYAMVTEDNYLRIYGVNCGVDDPDCEFTILDIVYGDYAKITRAIPETDEVKNVSVFAPF